MAIISFRHNFIFIKTSKTAGSSIEVDLARRVEDDAIVTPILPANAAHVPRNFETPNGTFYSHMTALEIRDILGAERFSRMFKFCVERDPVTKCISHFHMLCNSPLHNHLFGGKYISDWNAYCRSGIFPIDIDKYSARENGVRRVLVDQILRYEDLDQALPAVLRDCGIPDFRLEATEKADYSSNRLIEPSEVTDDQRGLIARAFAETNRLTGLYD